MVWTLQGSGVLVGPGFTAQSLVDAIRDVFLNEFAITAFDEFTNNVVFEVAHTSGTSYVRYRCAGTSSIQIVSSIYSSWDAVAHTGTDGSSELTSLSASSGSVTIPYSAYSGPEGFLVHCIASNSATYVLGWLIPQSVPPGWSGVPTIFSLYPGTSTGGIIFSSNGLRTPTNVPYGGSSREFKAITMPVYKSSNLVGERAVNTPFYFSIGEDGSNAAPSIVFQDFASVAGQALVPGDTVSVGTDIWMKIERPTTSLVPDVFMRIA